MQLCAGLDEAGRGPLAGPVSAACVILDPHFDLSLLKDSKVLSEKKREINKENLLKLMAFFGNSLIFAHNALFDLKVLP